MSARDKEAEIFKKYVVNKKILIADPSSSARSGIFKVFSELGVKPSQILLANNFAIAQEEINTKKPEIVIVEYDLGKSCGLELLQSQRTNNPDSKKSLFILVTGNTSQTAVARAAEEDIDAYILKPFTAESLRKTIISTALMKIHPPAYYATVELGKSLLQDGNIEEAERKFSEALAMDPKPALACYYLGQVKYLKKILNQAEGAYSKGLEFNKIHYKCLAGLFELLMELKQHEMAYEVVKKISQYFPANPKRLGEVLRLAIMNQKYEDVERYYSIFCNIDERSDSLIKYICAALVVCGKYYLQTNNRSRALELFQKAAATSAGRTNILKEVVMALVDEEMAKEASEFLKRFPPDTQSGELYLLLQFQVFNLTGNTSSIIAQGRELISKGIADPHLYKIMIQRSIQGQVRSAAENLAYEASQKFPDYKATYEGLLKGETPQKAS